MDVYFCFPYYKILLKLLFFMGGNKFNFMDVNDKNLNY